MISPVDNDVVFCTLLSVCFLFRAQVLISLARKRCLRVLAWNAKIIYNKLVLADSHALISGDNAR